MGMQILITGATGFIGRQLTRDLVKGGHSVRVLARSPRKARSLFGNTVEICPGDLTDRASLAEACRDVDHLYHVGGIYRFGLRHRREVWETNVIGTESLLAASAQAGIEKMIYVSSAGILKREKPSLQERRKERRAKKGDRSEGKSPQPNRSQLRSLLTESDFPATPPPFSSYKFSKWHAEKRVLAWAERGFPVTIGSPTCPIGSEDEGPTPTGQVIWDFMEDRFPFYCRTGLNFVSVEEVSEGLQRLALRGAIGERYILGYQNLWLKQFLAILAQETGIAAPRFCLPQWAIYLAGAGGEVAAYLAPREQSMRVCLETAVHSGRIQFFDNAKARQELGWNPTRSVRESVQDAIAWFRGRTDPSSLYSVPTPAEHHVR